MQFTNLMGFELIERIKNRDITVQEVTNEIFENIGAYDDFIHSFIRLSNVKALNKAI